MEEGGFSLNIAGLEAAPAATAPSRKQQRAQKWADKRALKVPRQRSEPYSLATHAECLLRACLLHASTHWTMRLLVHPIPCPFP